METRFAAPFGKPRYLSRKAPIVVDGQVWGGAAQGIGTALYEEMPFDDAAQPLATTLADYLLPGAGEVPSIPIDHMVTPSPISRFGQKGIGDSGAIGPSNAVPIAAALAAIDRQAPAEANEWLQRLGDYTDPDLDTLHNTLQYQ